MTDDFQSLKRLGYNIYDAFTKDSRYSEFSLCDFCRGNITMISNVIANDFVNVTNTKYGSGDLEAMNDREAIVFIFHIILYTTENCQLQNLFHQASELSRQTLTVYLDGEPEMHLEIGLSDQKKLHVNTKKTIREFSLLDCVPKASCSIRNEKLCPRIGVKYSEFTTHVTESNRAVIGSLFNANQTKTDEVVEICLDDYYEWLESVGVRPESVDLQVDSSDDISSFSSLTFVFVLIVIQLIA